MKFDKPLIMGVLNATPDSFSDGGKFIDKNQALIQCIAMLNEGADIIDIGGESSRPGAEPVSTDIELKRVLPIITELVKKTKKPISIDTYKPEIADQCIKAGAKIINDITGLTNPDMIKVAAKHNVPVIIMHMQNNPKTMQDNISYNNIIEDIITFFKKQIQLAKEGGVTEIILDPGIGFGKTLEHNLSIIKNIQKFKNLGYPILIGTSRKSFIGTLTGKNTNKRLEGSIASAAISIFNGADIVRVHDVKETVDAVKIATAIKDV